MQKQNTLYHKAAFSFRKISGGQYYSGMRCIVPNSLPEMLATKSGHLKAKVPSIIKIAGLNCTKFGISFQNAENTGVANGRPEEFSEEDDELCPAECVREFGTNEEFIRILEKAKKTNSLVVVDFYRTSCGSCKYIGEIFSKLCKGSGNQDSKVIFLKHNVIDEYEEQSEVAEQLRIKSRVFLLVEVEKGKNDDGIGLLISFSLFGYCYYFHMQTPPKRAVPLFHFYKDGILLEAFPTRDKQRIVAAIRKYTAPASPDI